VDGVPEPIEQAGDVVGIAQILHPHLQQFRGRPLQELAKAIVDQPEASGCVDLRDAHRRTAEQGTQILLLHAQSRFDALPHGHIRAPGETRNRCADHEHDRQQDGFAPGQADEGTAT
jgi:hypothetical protein